MKKLIILALLLMITFPVAASEEAVTDYYAHSIAEQYRNLCQYEKAREVHDYLIRNVQYDFTKNAYKSYGALVEGRAVCQGYSLAYREVLLHLGVKCNVLIGTTSQGLHAWNLVEVNGSNYFIDVTFDDKDDGKVYYDWFMLTQIRDHYAMFTLY